MTTEHQERIPELTLGWRLKMSLGDMSREQIAAVMDVTPSTISRWMADRGAPPRRPYLIQWALATGVSRRWLETGEGHPTSVPPPSGDGETTTHSDALAKLASQKKARHVGVRTSPRYANAA